MLYPCCGKQLNLPEGEAPRRYRCPQCRTIITVAGTEVVEETLDDSLHATMTEHYQAGMALLDENRPAEGADSLRKALTLLPKPIERWDAAGQILILLGDAHISLKKYEQAREELRQAILILGPENPYLHLLRGVAAYELGDLKQAEEELTIAYASEGKEFFEEWEKYFAWLKTRILPPASGEW